MIELLSMPFIQRAIVAGALVGFMGGYYGTFAVQRKMSFLGGGLAHAAFGGVALGLLLQIEPLWAAAPFTVAVAILITAIEKKTELSADASIGILFAVSVALGIIFLSIKENYTADAFAYLFGSILTVGEADLWISSSVAFLTIISIFAFWSKWAYASFDPELAETDRLNVNAHNYVLSIMLALAVVSSIKLVGIILIASFLVIPATAAKMLAKTFFQTTVLSIIFGVFSALAGLALSIALDLPSGPTIILTQTLIFICSYIIGKYIR